MNTCLCGKKLPFEECCGRFINGVEFPKKAVELMRSRYSAYVLKNGEYLYQTCSKRLQNPNDIEEIKNDDIQWVSLNVLYEAENEVTFMAYYKEENKMKVIKEHSYFIFEDERLKYDKGELEVATIARKDLCPCGSGKKYKNCCE